MSSRWASGGSAAARAASPLVGCGLRDRYELKPGQPGGRCNAALPGEPRVDHGRYARNRQGGFGHVRGEDHLAAADVVEHAVLSLGRQVAVERQHRMPLPLDKRPESLLAPPDLADARQEDEHMPGCGSRGLEHGLGHEIDEVPPVAMPQIPRLDRIHPAGGGDHPTGGRGRTRVIVHTILELHSLQSRARARRPLALALPCPEQPRDRPGLERRAHHDDPEIGPHRLPQPHKQTEDEIHLEAAFVEFIEHDRGDPGKRDVANEPPQHDPGRLDEKPSIPAYL
jgi:hypothetical protein